MPHDLLASARNGKWFPIEGEMATSVDDGKVVGAVITFRDATARQTHEREIRQQHKMQAVGRLAAGIAHDFNNLLFVMLGYTEEMLGKLPRQDCDLGALNEIKRAGEKAASITQQLLSFSRKEPLEKKNINLNELIGAEKDLFRRLGGPSLAWNFRLDPDLGTVRSDRGQLTQVLMNLVANARDSMPDGGGVTIETMNVDLPRPGESKSASEAFVAVSVTDTGSGMTAETAEHLFEPFFTTKERGSGTGLGLSIAHSIVTGDGGTINVESEPGCGSTFTIYLPRAEAAGAVPVVELPARGTTSEPSTVLLVEDQDGVRNLVRGYLLSAGYKVLEADNGEAAIHLANEYVGRIDVLITDVLMPRAGGLEVAQSLAPQRPEMKIIFISGYAQELLNGIETLPTDAQFLPKPFIRTELLKVVSDLLAGKKTLAMRMA
jgi:signal transduction histidine kinase/CheY-like chemotaxis protein